MPGKKVKKEGTKKNQRQFLKKFSLLPRLVLYRAHTRAVGGVFFRFKWQLEGCWVVKFENQTLYNLF